ncbi:MAG: acyl carrier protein [Magnetospirillum sp.]|nr:acyl carrier protein [Magnetospirillum sp.]
MSPDAIRAVLIEEIRRAVPGSTPEALPDDRPIRDEVDIDSMDFLSLVTALHQRLGIPIPEADYGRLDTLGHAEAYLAAQVAAKTGER